MPTTIDNTLSSVGIQAILLITRTRTGPRILLHYPPTPGESQDAAQSTSVDVDIPRRNGEVDGKAFSAQINNYDTDSPLPDRNHSKRRPSTTPSTATTSATATNSLTARPSTASLTTQRNLGTPFSESIQTPSQEVQQTWTTIFGFPADSLARMLAPAGRAWHKKRLELQLGKLCFLGCPIYERKEGGWTKERGRGKKSRGGGEVPNEITREGEELGRNEADGVAVAASQDDVEEQDSIPHQEHNSSGAQIPFNPTTAGLDNSDPLASFTTTSSSLPSSGNSGRNDLDDPSITTKDTLHLFNIVFVLSTSTTSQLIPGSATSADRTSSVDSLQPGKRVRELYTHCVKKMARALQVRQKKEGYVWEEVRKIIGVRIKAREAGASYAMTWPRLHSNSSLARALATTFNGLNQSSIAHLNLGSGHSLSLQLPQLMSTTQISTPTDPILQAIPSQWLTTFSPYTLETQIQDASAGQAISPTSALLLLVPADSLLREIAATPKSSLAAPLSYYIRSTLPTKTLQQLSRNSRLSLQNMQLLAAHLIHWRRARAISPLHHTNTYIVSPLADWDKLEQASSIFRARFPALPTLPSILARLSCPVPGATAMGPQSWGRLMPSPDHKDAYMEMLEWLVREAWVTQLRTFAWVLITKEVKAEVARKIRIDEREAAAANASISAAEEAVDTETDEQSVVAPSKAGTGVGRRRQSSQGSANLLSPRLSARLTVPRRTSEAASISSVSTAVRLPRRSSGMHTDAPSPVPRGNNGHAHRVSNDSARSSRPPELSNPASAPDTLEIQPSDFKDSIVMDPHKANAVESQWLEHVGQMQDAEVREVWPRLLKYFDGKHAIEEIATSEGMKRKVVSPIVAKLLGGGEHGGKGVLRIVRHW